MAMPGPSAALWSWSQPDAERSHWSHVDGVSKQYHPRPLGTTVPSSGGPPCAGIGLGLGACDEVGGGGGVGSTGRACEGSSTPTRPIELPCPQAASERKGSAPSASEEAA